MTERSVCVTERENGDVIVKGETSEEEESQVCVYVCVSIEQHARTLVQTCCPLRLAHGLPLPSRCWRPGNRAPSRREREREVGGC